MFSIDLNLIEGWWREQDSNLRRRTSADLQSAAFDRSAIPPQLLMGIRDLTPSVNWRYAKKEIFSSP